MDYSSDKLLLEPYEYLEKNPGKDFRSKMIAAFDLWIKVSDKEKSLIAIARIVSMLHTASLLVDDVQDDSELRRGAPVAHKIFGIASTINSANFVYFLALQKTIQLQKPHAMNIFAHELLQLHRGQGFEIRWRDTITCPTEEQYLIMVSNKTGGLLRLAVKLMQECSSSPDARETDYVPLVNMLGILFQVRDDYINLTSTTYHDKKGFAEDLTEGKFSFPIVHCLNTNPEKHTQLTHILRQKTQDVNVKTYAISILVECGSLEYTQRFLVAKEQEIKSEIERLGGNDLLNEILNYLAVDYKNNR